MRLAFAGTPEFARVALQALCEAGHEVCLVLTQPDRPAGRGMKLQASPVKAEAQKRQLTLAQPRSLRLDGRYPEDALAAQRALIEAGPEALIVAAYGLILPRWVLDLPAHGCLNIHASLLPRWRGAAPIHRAIEAGDTHTGVTIMQMDEGLDTGAMLRRQSTPIGVQETTGQLHDRLASLGARLMAEVLNDFQAIAPTPQPEAGITYAHKIDKAESWLDWRLSAVELARRLRAFDLFPGGSARLRGEPLKVWAALEIECDCNSAPGTVVAVDPNGIDVATGSGVLRLTELQKPGGKRLPCADFLRGHAVSVGAVFEADPA
ncbi:MAG: methionyl-tRNA formyltransferase [Alphaproteobacteria bacterium]|nr:methionyl-tRNA formyltransferase [Alphaproteobacteria bacterium]